MVSINEMDIDTLKQQITLEGSQEQALESKIEKHRERRFKLQKALDKKLEEVRISVGACKRY